MTAMPCSGTAALVRNSRTALAAHPPGLSAAAGTAAESDYAVAPHGTVVFVRRISAAFRGLGSTTFVTLAHRMKPFGTGDTVVTIPQLVRDQNQLGRRFDAFARGALTRLFDAFTGG